MEKSQCIEWDRCLLVVSFNCSSNVLLLFGYDQFYTEDISHCLNWCKVPNAHASSVFESVCLHAVGNLNTQPLIYHRNMQYAKCIVTNCNSTHICHYCQHTDLRPETRDQCLMIAERKHFNSNICMEKKKNCMKFKQKTGHGEISNLLSLFRQ